MRGTGRILAAVAIAAAGFSALAENPYQTMKEQPAEFFRLIPQVGVTHLMTEDDEHNAIWDMAVSPEGRLFFGACGETYVSVFARMYEYDAKVRRLVRHFDLEKRLALDHVGLRTSKFHTSMSFIGGHRMLTTTHTTSPSPRHPTWMPYGYFNHPFEGFKGSDLLVWDYETNETKGLGKFTSHDTVYGATYDPKNGDYFGITCLTGRGVVYNLRDGSVRDLGQVTDSRTSKTFLCSDGHIYGSTYSGALFRYNTDRRDVEYLGVHADGLLRMGCERDGVLYFTTGTAFKSNRGMMLYGYVLKTGELKRLGCPVPVAPRLDKYRPDEVPQYHAYGMAFDSKGRMWYGVSTVTPTVHFCGIKLFMWDFLHGKAPVDCGFLGTPLRTVSEMASMTVMPGDILVCSDGNHVSWKEDACGIVAIELDRFVPALSDASAPRPFSHDFVNYLPYPVSCWRHYPKDDLGDCLAKFAVRYDEVLVGYRRFTGANPFRICSKGASGVSVWERVGRENAAVRRIEWTAPDAFRFWCGGERGWRIDSRLDSCGKAHVESAVECALPPDDGAGADKVPPHVKLPSVPGRQYIAKASAAAILADGSMLAGTHDGMLAHVSRTALKLQGGDVRNEGGVMTGGPVHRLALSPDGETVWGVSGHDQGLGSVFMWSRRDGLRLLGLPPDVAADSGRNVHVYKTTTIAVSPDGAYVAVGGTDELGGVVVFPVVSALSDGAKRVREMPFAPLEGAVTNMYASGEPGADFLSFDFTIRAAEGSEVLCRMSLPAASRWDGRLWGHGHGGYAGSVWNIPATGRCAHVMCDLGMGRATGGRTHAPKSLNDEEWKDFGWRATHLMTVYAKRFCETYYGRPPDRSYFLGGSTGGGQGLHEAIRFPEDYDGIIAVVPAQGRTALEASRFHRYLMLTKDGAPLLTTNQLKIVSDAAVAAMKDRDERYCAGRYLSDPRDCEQYEDEIFDLAARKDPIFADADIRRRLHEVYAGPVVGGRRVHHGFPYGAILTYGPGNFCFACHLNGVPGAPKPMDATWDDFLAFVDARAGDLDAVDPDLRRFAARGGKLISLVGFEDQTVPFSAAMQHWEETVELFGSQERVDEFYRIYFVPGSAHGKGRAFGALPAYHGGMNGMLVNWVENGVRPEDLRLRTRAGDEIRVAPFPYKASLGADGVWRRKKAFRGLRRVR